MGNNNIAIKIYNVTVKCALKLQEQGYSKSISEQMVAKHIDGSKGYSPEMLIASLKMRFLDSTVKNAVKTSIKF